jgi:hypothetical protein
VINIAKMKLGAL